MISVIIPYNADQTYLIRCLNSLKRQTYGEVEIIFITEKCDVAIRDKYNLKVIECNAQGMYDGINRGISSATGEFLFFCSMTSVLPTDILQTLYDFEKRETENKYYYDIFVENGNEYSGSKMAVGSFYGKLFKRTQMVAHNIFTEDFMFAELLLVTKLFSKQKMVAVADKYIYETADTWLVNASQFMTVSEQLWGELLDYVTTSASQGLFMDCIYEFLKEKNVLYTDLLWITEKKCHVYYKLNYMILGDVAKQWWYEISENKNYENYASLQRYFRLFETDKDYVNLLLNDCGLSRKQFDYIKSYDVDEALFFIEEEQKGSNAPIAFLEKQTDALMAFAKIVEKKLNISILDGITNDYKIINGAKNGLVHLGNIWFYYEDGDINYDFCGLVKNEYGWFYVKDGIIDFSFNGIATNAYGEWAVVDGKLANSVNGYRKLGDTEAFFDKGKLDKKITGLYKIENTWKCFKNGLLDTEYEGLMPNQYGIWYIESGKINFLFEGLVKYENRWLYVNKGKVDSSFTGFAKNAYGWWYVENGLLDSSDVSMRQDIEKAAMEYKKLNGYELSAFSIDKYEKGELGLKTISKSLMAWIRCKCRK